MDLFGKSWFDTAAKSMDWSAARQKAIAENVANADTPGFVGKDVSSFESHLEKTAGSGRGPVDVSEARNGWGGSFDGNSVVVEEQIMLSSTTASQYALASTLYKKGHDLIALASSSR